MFHKVHKSAGEQKILAVADKNVIGKTLKQGIIEFDVSEKFYKGEEIGKRELEKMLPQFANINLVGKKAVGIALEQKLASEKQVIKIAGVEHLQIFKV